MSNSFYNHGNYPIYGSQSNPARDGQEWDAVTTGFTLVEAAITPLSSKDALNGYVGLTLYKINFKNAANTFTNFLTNATTASRTYTFPDKDLTVAGLTDFATPPSIGNTTPNTGAFTTLSATGLISSSIASAVGVQAFRFTNPTSGTGAYAYGTVNAGTTSLAAYAFSQAYTTSGPYIQSSSVLESTGDLALHATGANSVSLFTNLTRVASVKKDNTFVLQGGVSSAGCGIAFPTTQFASTDPNTLDDYEEGSWAPNQGGGLTVVGAFTSSGSYIKIGRQVTVYANYAGATSVACSAGGLMSSNLPFTSAIQGNGSGALNSAAGGFTTTVGGSSTNLYASQAATTSITLAIIITYFI